MAPYALLLNGDHYSVLLDNAAPDSEAHIALLRATPPTMGQYYVLISNTKAVEQLMDLAARYCQDAVLVIRGSSNVKRPAPNELRPCF
jgi:hypothetical protein